MSNKHSNRPLISNDNPIQHPDEDLFGVDPFARMVARGISGQEAPEGTVVAINGPWGGGKSSAVNLVIHHLNDSGSQMEVVSFNPWWFAGSTAIGRAFLSTIGSALQRSLKEKGKTAISNFLRRLGALETYIETASQSAEKGLAGGLAYLALGDRSLEEDHSEISDALRQQEKRFLIIIDDIDRLSPDEALLVFGLVKSIGRLPNVTYLLAFDRLLIERLLEERFPSEGGQYLEKILQASFDLPRPPPEALREIFLSEVNRLFDVADTDVVRFMNLFHDVVVPNLTSARNVNRLTGSLRVTSPAVKGDVDAADFMSIEALRMFWPTVYRNVRDHQAIACEGIGRQGHGVSLYTIEDVDAALLSGVSETDHRYLKVALQRLFPRLEGVWSNMNYGPDWNANWDLARRVCCPTHFPAYFQYAVSSDVLSGGLRDEIVARAGDREFVRRLLIEGLSVRRSAGGTRAALLLEELSLLAERVAARDVAPLLDALFGIADQLDVLEDEARGFSFGSNPLRIHWILNKLLLGRFPLEERSALLLAAIQGAEPAWCADLAERCRNVYEPRNGKDPTIESEALADGSTAKKVVAIALDRLREVAGDGRILDANGTNSPLWALYRLSPSGSEEIRTLTDQYLENDRHTILLARALTSTTWTHAVGLSGMGDRVAKASPRVDRSAIDNIVDGERLIARVDQLLENRDINAEDRAVLQRFHDGWNADGTVG